MKNSKPNLADALFPKVRQCVLQLLYGQPDTAFYTNEIIRLSGVGTGAVQRELEKLASVGLISIHAQANKKLYRANTTNPLFEELRSIVLKTFGLTAVLQEALSPISDKIEIAFVYGSVAKKADTAESDIDLMIITNTLSYAEIYPLLEQPQKKLGRTINPTFYTVEKWRQRLAKSNHFISEIQKQPKLFLVGTHDELSKLKQPNEN